MTSADDQGEVGGRAVLRRALVHAAARRARRSVPDSLRHAQHRARADAILRRARATSSRPSIIPTTWREGGIGVTGVTDFDLTWDVGITTGFNLAKWDPTSDEGKASPLGSIHQEMQLAKAADLSGYAALNWRGYPGLLLGGSVFYGKAGQKQPDFPSQNAAVTLAEAHARWTPGPFDLLGAVRARPHQRHRALQPDDRRQPDAGAAGVLRLVRAGGVVCVAAQATISSRRSSATSASTPAGNMRRSPQGLTPDALPTEGVTTLGASFFVTPNIVFKADYQWFSGAPTRASRPLPARPRAQLLNAHGIAAGASLPLAALALVAGCVRDGVPDGRGRAARGVSRRDRVRAGCRSSSMPPSARRSPMSRARPARAIRASGARSAAAKTLGTFFVDAVIGKQEYIDYALALDRDGPRAAPRRPRLSRDARLGNPQRSLARAVRRQDGAPIRSRSAATSPTSPARRCPAATSPTACAACSPSMRSCAPAERCVARARIALGHAGRSRAACGRGDGGALRGGVRGDRARSPAA